MPNIAKEKTEINPIGEKWKEGDATIGWNQICFVRSLNTIDQLGLNEDLNKVSSLCLISSTKGEQPRLTNHWTINHKVVGYDPKTSERWGVWENCPIIIISPGQATIEQNGIPQNLNAVDTFWLGDVTLPEGSVVAHIGPIPDRLKNIPGIKDREVLVDATKWQEMQRLRDDMTQIDHNSEKYMDTYLKWHELSLDVDVTVNQQINQLIEHMGYTPFYGDYGRGMRMRGVDDAIFDLAYKQNIPEYDFHTSSITKPLDNTLRCLSYPPEELFTRDPNEESIFKWAIDYLDSYLERSEAIGKVINGNYLYVTLFELYNFLNLHHEKIMEDKNGHSKTN